MGTTERRGTARRVSRRGFLTSSAIVGTGLMAAPLVLAGEADRQAPLNVALIGCGKQGRVLAAQVMKNPGIRFKALCDIWEQWSLRYTSRRLHAYGHEALESDGPVALGEEDFRV